MRVKLGLVTPTCGLFASIGLGYRQAVDLYLAQHGDELGGYAVDLVCVEEGTGGLTAVPQARQLIGDNPVDLVTGIVTTATSGAVFSLFEAARIPVIGTLGYPYPSVRTANVSPYLWHAGGSNPPYTVSMAQHMAETVDASRGVYLISSDFLGGHLLLSALADAHKRYGGRVVETSFPPLAENVDYRPFLEAIERSEAAGVYAVFDGPDAVRFVQQFSAFDFSERPKLFATSGLVTPALLESMGEAAEGITTNGFYSSGLENAENDRFVADFTDRYQSVPDDYEGRMWDAMTLIDLALGRVDELTPRSIADALASVTAFASPRGAWWLDSRSHVAVLPMNLWQVANVDGRMVNEFVSCLGTFDPASGQPLP